MTPARASESTAALKLDPAGTMTRTLRVFDEPHPATSTDARAAAATNARLDAARRLTRSGQRESMLQQECCGHGVDIALPASDGSAHLTDGA